MCFLFVNYILIYTEENITHVIIEQLMLYQRTQMGNSHLFSFSCALCHGKGIQSDVPIKSKALKKKNRKQDTKSYTVPSGSSRFMACILQLYSYLLETCYFLGDMAGSQETEIIRSCPLHLNT